MFHRLSLFQSLFRADIPGNRFNPIFIVAAPRSGTTWLSKILNAHPEAYCTENRLFGNYADFIQDDGSCKPRLRVTLDKYIDSILLHVNYFDLGLNKKRLETELTASVIDAFWRVYTEHAKGKLTIDKITPYVDTSHHVKAQIQRYFPHSRIIYLVRDGRDVCTSGVFHWLKKHPANREYSELERHRRDVFLKNSELCEPLVRFFTDSEIEEWAKTWVQPLENFYVKNSSRIYLVRYEDMLTNMDRLLDSLFDFMKIGRSPKTIDRCVAAGNFEKMSGGNQQGNNQPGEHVRKGVSGDWKNYFTKRDGEIFNDIAGSYLLELGYVKDLDWFRNLPESIIFKKT